MTATAERLDPADAHHTWTLAGHEPLTALRADVELAYCEAMRRCFEATGSPIARRHVVRIVDGYSYRRDADADEDELAARVARHKDGGRRLLDAGTTLFDAQVRPEVAALVKRLRRHPRASEPLRAVVEHLAEAVGAFTHVMGDLHWRMVGAVDFDWPSEFAAATGRRGSEAAVFLAAVDSMTSRLVRRLLALAELAQSDERLGAAVAAGDAAGLRSLPDTQPVRAFRSRFRSLLRDYGLRTGHGWGSTVGFAAPTWNMRPQIPLSMVASYARSNLAGVKATAAAAKRARAAATRRVRDALAGDDARLAAFERALRTATSFARQMEDHNHLMDQFTAGVLSEAVDLAGARLVAAGLIDERDDVLHLGLDDLRAIASGGTTDARDTVAARREEHERRLGSQPPATIGAPAQPATDVFSRYAPPAGGLRDGVLHGTGASPGRYTGRARVCPPSPVPPDVGQGDVLVARDAGPAWTPVFALLGALVLDHGATFQHAAVMAREFRIPCVLGTAEATTVIADGATVTVDGEAGTVELPS